MTDDDYEALVHRLEALSRRRPLAYRFTVAAWAGLGYASAWITLGILVAITAMLVWGLWWMPFGLGYVKIAIFAVGSIGFLVSSLRAFWFRLSPPSGIVLRPSHCPELFAEIDHVAARVGVRRPPVVVLNPQFNAAVAEVPRFGPLPLYRRHLILGLPLLESMTRDEFRALLGHEFGHLQAAHGRFNSWIYRTRRTWAGLQAALDESTSGGLTRRFLHWFGPRFAARSFVLSRQDEYAADRWAAKVTSPTTVAAALVRAEVGDRILDLQFWDVLHERSRDDPHPPSNVYGALADEAHSPSDRERWQTELTRALFRDSDVSDTHPCLRDRVAALGVDPTVPPAVDESSCAAALLGPMRDAARQRFSAKWHADVGPLWRERHGDLQLASTRLAELEAESIAPRTFDETMERGALAERLGRSGTAITAYRHAAAVAPDNALAAFALGRVLTHAESDECRQWLERARELEPDLAAAATHLLMHHLITTNDLAAANQEKQTLRAHSRDWHVAQQARNSISKQDEFLPPALDEPTMARLRAHFNESDARSVWVARKAVPARPDEFIYVFCIEPSGFGSNADEIAESARLAWDRCIHGLELEHEWIACDARTHGWLVKRLGSMLGTDLV